MPAMHFFQSLQADSSRVSSSQHAINALQVPLHLSSLSTTCWAPYMLGRQ